MSGGQCSGDYGRIFGCSRLYRLLPICLIISSYHDLILVPGWWLVAGAGYDLCFLITSECNVIPPTYSHQPTAGTTQMEKYFTSTKTVSRDGE